MGTQAGEPLGGPWEGHSGGMVEGAGLGTAVGEEQGGALEEGASWTKGALGSAVWRGG